MARIYIPSTGECELLDDFDFMAEARTIRFGLEGIQYEIDLSAKNVEKLRTLLEPYIRLGHIVARDDTTRKEHSS